jgi:peptide/nickel transport system substrate-binding protein/oligopeptide transport system substrate-binding protein
MRVIGIPSYLKEFQNTKVRQALSLAIDRKTIVSSLLNGAGSAANTLFSPSTVFGTLPNACSVCSYDPSRAKTLLTAGGGLPGSITLNFSGDPTIPQAVANMWRAALGVNVQLNSLTSTALAQEEANGTLNGPFMARYGPIYPHIANVLNILYMPNGIANNTKYAGVSAIRDILRANNASAGVSLAAYQKAERQVLADLPLIPVTNERFAIVWSSRLGNVGGGVQGLSDLAQVQVK